MPLALNPIEQFAFFTLNQGPAPMLDLYGGPAARTVLAGIRLNVFESLAERPATAEDLAQRLHLDARGAGILLGTLASLGYITPILETFTQIFSVSFFLPVGGQAYTFDEMRGWLIEAGFAKIQLKRSLKAGGFLLFAENSG